MPELALDLLKQEVEYASANNDWQGAFEAYNISKDWLDGSTLSRRNPRAYSQYYSYLMKLKFLCLNYFDEDQDYYDLLKDDFALSQEIPGYDLWQKIEAQLLYVSDIDRRDAFKDRMREALERSDSILVSRQNYQNLDMPIKVSDWIKDIVANLGLDRFDKLKKMEYLANGRYIKLLSPADRDKVKNLLDIYERLKLSSRTPAGYENAVVMNIDGRPTVFERGEMEEIQTSIIKDIKASIPVEDTKEMAAAEQPQPSAGDDPVSQLENIMANYAENSLEYKAINQEISRLKAAKLREAQKSNGGRR